MLCALIMAGGKGERFWPISTDERPKQFLNLLGDKTMIQMTVDRLEKLIPMERIFVVTAKRYVALVKEQIPTLPYRNIIVEPVGKNTAPCIGLSAFIINKYYKNSTIAVLPSDHLIENEDKFRSILSSASKFIDVNEDAVVTIGITPNRPETGYGYINFHAESQRINGLEIRKVNKFVEKPNYETAVEYLKQGDFLWNGGMFVWKTSTILKLTSEYLNNTYKILREIATTEEDNFEEVLDKKYNEIESISVDFGIMEKADNIYVIPGDFGWDDLGNWTSLERYKEKDEKGNVKNENCTFFDSQGNVVISNKKVILNDVEDLIIVETDDCIMISSKRKEQNIKLAKNAFNKEV